MFLYISYALPVAAGLFAYRRSWTAMGPFDLGGAYPFVAVCCLVGVAALLYIGVQPPNDQALTVTLAMIALTVAVWFGFERRRFQGPPSGANRPERDREIAAAERAVGEA